MKNRKKIEIRIFLIIFIITRIFAVRGAYMMLNGVGMPKDSSQYTAGDISGGQNFGYSAKKIDK
jgi:hypothetical protein